jgi:hypothetical protein
MLALPRRRIQHTLDNERPLCLPFISAGSMRCSNRSPPKAPNPFSWPTLGWPRLNLNYLLSQIYFASF